MSADPDMIMARVRAEVQEQQMQELVQTLSEKVRRDISSCWMRFLCAAFLL